MAEQYFPFENVDTTESQFSKWARNFQETGIQGQPTGTDLKITAGGLNMSIDVAAGQAFIRGHYYINTASINLPVTSAGINTRIDLVVLELDPVANTIHAKIVEGTAVTSSPVAPTLTQTDTGVYQFPIATLTIPNSTLAITNAMLTDTRTFMGHRIGVWTTSTRPATPTANQTLGFNTDLDQHEFWNGSAWVEFTPTDSVRVSDYSTTGDILVGNGVNNPDRLPIGGNGALLKSDGTTASWLTLGASGQVLQSNGTTAVWANTPSALQSIAVSGDIDTYLTNTAGNYIIDRFWNTNGRLFVDNVVFNADSDTIKHQILPANAKFEYHQNWVTANANATTWSMVYTNGKFLTAGRASTDGTTWTNLPSATPNNSQDPSFIANFAGVWITGGFPGNNYLSDASYIYTSTDLATWTKRFTNGASDLANGPTTYAISDGTTLVVKASGSGITYTTNGTSFNGATGMNVGWNQFAPTCVNHIYGSGGWVINATYNSMSTSTNGITWTNRTFSISTSQVYANAFGAGVYVAAGQSGTLASTTTPTTAWTMRTSGFGTSAIHGVAYGAGLFVAVGAGGRITTSPDGTTWTGRTSPTGTQINGVSFLNNKFIAGINSSEIMTSTDGITWSIVSSNTATGGTVLSFKTGQASYVDGKYYHARGGSVFVSTDLVTWDYMVARGGRAGAVVNGLVIYGSTTLTDPAIYTTTDGMLWRTRASIASNHTPVAFAYTAGSGYLVSSYYGTTFNISSSTDLASWTIRYTTTNAAFNASAANGIATNGTAYITGIQIGGSAQALVYSTNGLAWSLAANLGNVYSVAYGNGVFVIDINRVFYTSTDAITWTNRGANLAGDAMFWSGTEFVAGNSQNLYVSTNGITWTPRYAPTGVAYSITGAASNGTITAVSNASDTFVTKKWSAAIPERVLLSNYGVDVTV